MDEQARWIRGYWFWKGQYTARNAEFNKYLYEIHLCIEDCSKRIDETQIEFGNVGVEILLHWFITSNLDLSEYEWLDSKSKKLILKTRNYVNKFGPRFQCDAAPFSSSKILTNVANEKYAGEGCYADKEYPMGLEYLGIDTSNSSFTHLGIDLKSGFVRYEISLKNPVNVTIEKLRRNLIMLRSNYTKSPDQSYSPQWEFVKDGIVQDNQAQYKINGEASRAIGLWLYDFLEKRWADPTEPPRGEKIKAYKAIQDECSDELIKLGRYEASDTQFARWLNKTIRCIKHCEVLEI